MKIFDEVLDAANKLSPEEQETLIEILHRRLADNRRSELVKDIRTSQEEFESGASRPATPDQIIKEITS